MRINDDDMSNVEDRRGDGSSGGGGGLSFGGGTGMGLGGFAVLLVLSLIFGRNFFSGVRPGPGPGPGMMPRSQPVTRNTPEARSRLEAEKDLQHVAVSAFNDVQHYWQKALPNPPGYRDAKLVLFWDATSSACGGASAQTGPFYCPPDEKVFIDLGFYRELARRFKAPGAFAQAYVIAHEVGHHVQNLMGIERKVRAGQRRSPRSANGLSVRMELQADCLAGVWAHSAAERKLLDPGDIDDGLRAAAAVGDDHIQKMAGARVSPESWTHGSAAQRSHWFRQGYDSGALASCDTFSAETP